MVLQSISRASTYKYYPIDISITIHSDGDEYEATLLANGIGPQSFPIGLTHHKVEELNLTLKQAIEEVRRNCDEEGVCSEALSPLANAGKSAFNTIFEDGASILFRALDLIHTETQATIEISTKNFFIPWELLYDGSLDKVDVSRFWGMRYIISRTIIQKQRPGAMVSPIIQSLCPRVGLIACDEDTLENVAKKEIPMLRELYRNNQIFLLPLRALDAAQHHTELEYFGQFLDEEELQIAHFACHSIEKKLSSQSYLDIANNFCITIEDFRARKFGTKHNPLVILNACLTGIIDPLSISGWAAEFWKRGARGVLATEFNVPDWFAAIFIEELYKHLLSEKPIGESLWATRCYFWEKKRNPLGLAYALYSPLAVRIVK